VRASLQAPVRTLINDIVVPPYGVAAGGERVAGLKGKLVSIRRGDITPSLKPACPGPV
jgi:hypothetical protein